jgi:hypothetical protein
MLKVGHAVPDFLSGLVEAAKVMRLSLGKAAHADMNQVRVAGNSGFHFGFLSSAQKWEINLFTSFFRYPSNKA